MKVNKGIKTLFSMSLTAALIAGNVMCFPASAYAYSRCTDTWTAQLEPAETSKEVTSPLLAAAEQLVYIKERKENYEIEIPIRGGDAVEWEIQVISNDPDWLRASIEEREDAAQSGIYLKAETGLAEEEIVEEEISEKTEEQIEEITSETLTEETETTSEEETELSEGEIPVQAEIPVEDTTTVEGSEGSTTTEGKDSTTEEGEGSSTTEGEDSTTEEEEENTAAEGEDTVIEGEEENTTTEGEDSTTEGGNGNTTTEDEDSTTEGGNGNTTTEDEDTIIEMPDSVSAKVILSCGETMLSATFVFPMKEREDASEYTGTLESWPERYHPSIEFSVTNGDTDSELYYNKGNFPSMTKYVINGEVPVVLYDGGTILLPANAIARIDLSHTELNVQEETEPVREILEPAADMASDTGSNNIELSTAGKVYNMTYTSGPVLEKRNIPYIMNEQGLVLPVPYMLGKIEPTIMMEHLTIDDEELVWEPAEEITYQQEEDGNILLKAKSAQAGTYRATIFWIDNHLPIYILKTAFFIQYESVDQGGSK